MAKLHDSEWGHKPGPEICHVCGESAGEFRTVFRCQLCGLPVCSQCMEDRADGYVCWACAGDPAVELAVEDVSCPKCRGVLGGFLVDSPDGGVVCEACGYVVPVPADDDPGWDRLATAVKGEVA